MKWSERRLHSELAKPDRVLHSNGSLMAAHMLVEQAQWKIWGQWGFIPTYFWQMYKPYFNRRDRVRQPTLHFKDQFQKDHWNEQQLKLTLVRFMFVF